MNAGAGEGVSVVIAAYNAAAFIAEAITSVLAQDYQGPIECIVIDDGSTDNTGEIASTFAATRVIRQSNSGASAARNRGVAEAGHPWIAFLDADDRMAPARIRRQLERLSEEPTASLCATARRVIDQSGQPMPEQPDSPPTRIDTSDLFAANPITFSSLLLSRRLFASLGGFNTCMSHAEDYEFELRASMQGPIICIADRLTDYRLHGAQATGKEVPMAIGRLRARESFLTRHPEAMEKMGAAYTRRIMSLRAREFAYGLATAGYAREARHLYRIAMRVAPLDATIWRSYLRSFLPFN